MAYFYSAPMAWNLTAVDSLFSSMNYGNLWI